ncbi:MAG: DUF4252 domain-containing protein [Prevotella sp.]|jgi:hypothetical protein|nr:DUF4252 domain-containing protein [Prevotella sp.]
MKKIFTLFALTLLLATNSMAQTAADIFNEFKDKPNVQFVSLPKTLMSLAANGVEDENKKELLKKMDSIVILSIEDDDQLVKQFEKKVKNLSKKGYEQMVNSNDDGEKAQILVKTKGDAITEMLVISIEDNECALVQICGNIRPQDVNDLKDFGQ